MSAIELNTVFKIKGGDLTLYVERGARSDDKVLCVVFLPENVISNVPDNRFDARTYQAIEKKGIEYVSKAEFKDIWNKRAGKYSTYKELPDWVKFKEQS